MKRTKKEFGKEVYEKYDLSTKPPFRRICTLIYVLWLFIEGLITAFHKVTTPGTPAFVAYGMQLSVMYFLSASLLLVLLHTYIGRQALKYCFRTIMFVHQITFAAISLRMYACATKEDQVGQGFRVILLCFCALGETGAFIIRIKETLPNKNRTLME